ncbi:unnamed protein product [Polarella glacialis]|uniref:Uncharacterized protein n=1 Tax=Polarella glacialis TaxID=89957 RepID=A0A813EU41_POLGL|nr:unnamed protein product [Polarella glacialis]CAE8698642.1 unnamed protein product [Polarella glacialis]
MICANHTQWNTALTFSTDSVVSDADYAIITKHGTATTNPLMLVDRVFCCRVATAFAPNTERLTFSVAADLQPVLSAILRSLAKTGAVLKFGTPPKSSYERQLAKILLQMSEWQETP